MKAKKGELQGIAKSIVYSLVGIIVALVCARYLLPEVSHSLNNLTSPQRNGTDVMTTVPFISLFSSSGLLMLVLMVTLIIGVIGYFKFKGGGK